MPVPPEMPVGSLGCSAEVVVDSELRLLVSVAVADSVAVSETEVDVKVRIGPPGLVLVRDGESESVVSGSETASAWPAAPAEGPARRRSRAGRQLTGFILVVSIGRVSICRVYLVREREIWLLIASWRCFWVLNG